MGPVKKSFGLLIAALVAGLIAGTASAQDDAKESSSTVMATVGPLKVTRADFEVRAKTGRAEYEKRKGSALPAEFKNMLERQILEGLIRANLLTLEAERQGIKITDAEAEAKLKSDPFFQRNGAFDESRFLSVKANNPPAYQEALRKIKRETAARRLDERIQNKFRPEEAQVRAAAERALSRAKLEYLALRLGEVSGKYPEPREADILAYYRDHSSEFRRGSKIAPLREVAREIRAKLREDTWLHHEERELRAVFDKHRAQLGGFAYRLRYAVTDARSVDPGAPTEADLDRFYRGHLADYTSYNATSGGIVSKPLAEVREEVRSRWIEDQRMLATRSLAEQLEKAWSRGQRDRRLERSASIFREVGPLPIGARVDTGFAGAVLTDALAQRGIALGVGIAPHEHGLIVYHVHDTLSHYTPTFEEIAPVLAAERKAAIAEDDERHAREMFEKDPEHFATGNVLHFTRVVFWPPPLERVPLTRAEVEHHHSENIERYSAPELISARHILVSPADSSPEADAQARRKAEDLLRRVRAGEDFAALAEQYSDDPPTRRKGGDLGYFGRGTMLEAFDRTAFTLKPGEVSDLVKTEVGYHIIKVSDHVPMVAEPLTLIYANVGADAAAIKAKRMARERADSVYRSIKTPAQALAAAHKLRLDVVRTTHTIGNLANYMPELRPSFARLEKVPMGTLYPGVVSLKAGEAVIQWPDSVAKVSVSTWAQARGRAIQAYVEGAGRRAIEAKRAELDSLVAAGWSFDSLATLWGGLDTADTRAGVGIRKLGGAAGVVDSLIFGGRRAPALDVGEVSNWVETPEGSARIRLKERVAPNPTLLAGRIESERRLATERGLFDFFEELKHRYPVRILDPKLRDIVVPHPETSSL